MIPVPTPRLLGLLLIPLGLLVLGFLSTAFLISGIVVDLGMLVFLVYDYLQAAKSTRLKFSVTGGNVFSIDRESHFSLEVINTGNRPLQLELALELPMFWEEIGRLPVFELKPGAKKSCLFRLRPTRRGKYEIAAVAMRVDSGSGLYTLNSRQPLAFPVEVYPDILELNQYLRLARRNRLGQMGIHKNRYTGMNSELEYLREYHRDDPAERIEWKVTTRINRPVTKVFRTESGSQIALVLDCGRLMIGEQHGLNTLDYAVNAVLMLGNIIFRMGDQLSVFAFSDRIIAELPPTKGKDALKRLSSFVTGLKPEFVESNYKLMFEYLRSRLRKRSVVIFFSDMIDDINYQLFRKYFGYLNKRHYGLLVLLRDVILEQYASAGADTALELYNSAAAKDMFLKRNEAVAKLKLSRINVLDLLPRSLTPRLIDKFLELKARQLV